MRWRGALLAVAYAASLAGCELAPHREIAAAEEQIEAARTRGADRYVPERLHAAEEALSRARRQVEERDYRSALSSANEAAELARQAAQAVDLAREAARLAAAGALGEARRLLDEARAARAQAVADRVPAPSLAEPDARAQRLRERADDLESILARDVLAAREGAETLRSEAARLSDDYRTAERPQPRGRSRARRRP